MRSRLHAGILYIYRYGPIAQSREQRLCTPKVAGWIPARSTTYDTGRLLDDGRPVFRTAHRLASFRLPCRPSCRRADRADCLPRNRPAAHDTEQSVHLPRDDTRRKADSHLLPIGRHCYITSDIVIFHHDKSSFPPHAPHMRHGERGEIAAVCLPTRPVPHGAGHYSSYSHIGAIRRDRFDLRIFRGWRIFRLLCQLSVLFYKIPCGRTQDFNLGVIARHRLTFR